MPPLGVALPRRSGPALAGLGALLRITITVTLLLAAHYLYPDQGAGQDSDLPWLFLELAIFGVIVAFETWAIMKAKHPRLRGSRRSP